MLFNPFNSTTMRQQQPRRIHIRRMPLSRDIIHPDFTHQKRTQSGQEELPQQTPTTEPVEQYKDLPQSFLIRVFESLDEVQRLRMEHVNRTYQEAAMKAWSKSRFIEIPPQEYVAEEDQLMVKPRKMFKLVARRAARQVRELTVRAEFARDKVFHLLYRTPFLTHLWLQDINILNTVDFRDIGTHLPNLRALGAIDSGWPARCRPGFVQMIEKLTQLELLFLHDCWSNHLQFFQLLPFPQSLRMLVVKALSAPGMHQLTIPALEQLSTTCPNTMRVICIREDSQRTQTVQTIMETVGNFRNLSVLELDIRITVQNFELLDNLPTSLVALRLGIIPGLQLPNLCARLPNLEHLAVAIPEVHGENVEQALTQLERLRSLSLIILKDNDDDETPIRTPNVQERQERVFIELASRGQLEYFHTNLALTLGTALAIIENSPLLGHLYFRMRYINHAENEGMMFNDGIARFRWAPDFSIKRFLQTGNELRSNQQKSSLFPAEKRGQKLRLCVGPMDDDTRRWEMVDDNNPEQWIEDLLPTKEEQGDGLRFYIAPCASPVVADVCSRYLTDFYPDKFRGLSTIGRPASYFDHFWVNVP